VIIFQKMNMQEVKVLCFGITKEILGASVLIFSADKFDSVGSIRKYFAEFYPALAQLKSLRIAVNDEYAKDDQVIRGGDEVVLIPPVSGG